MERQRKRGGACCAAMWCRNSRANSSVKLFRIPKDDRFNTWFSYMNRPDLAELSRNHLYDNYRLCSDHFVDTDYADPQKTKLLRLAVPSVIPADTRLFHPANRGSASAAQPSGPELVPGPSHTQDSPVIAVQAEGTGQSPECLLEPLPGPSGLCQGTGQSPPRPPTPQPGPSGLCQGSTPVRRGPKKKIYTPRTTTAIRKLKGEAQKYKRAFLRLKKSKSPRKITKGAALQTLKPLVTPAFFNILGSQVLLQGREKKGRRWPQELREFALSLYFHGPKAYRFLSKMLALPTPRSLRKWLSEVPVTPGIIPGVITLLKNAVKDWPLQDRVCVIMFDEMSLRPNLQYDRKNDVVIGFSDDGAERTMAVANTAFVALLSGISKPWVQPLAFAVVKTKLHADKIKKLLLALINQLRENQLIVKAIVCDQGTSNVTLLEKLKVTPDNPFFEVGGHKVYFLFDTPHLIKCTRNNLRAPHKLSIGSEIVDWTYIRQLYECSHPLRFRLARKLTDDHIYKRPFNSMKVKLATQVLSESVSVAMSVMIALGVLPGAAKSTAEFVERMDKLFDCLNSKTATTSPGKMNYGMSTNSEHLTFLKEAVEWISSWKFDSPRQPHTLRGWLVTIQAVLMLWEDLSQNFQFTCLLTRHLQQDPLENLFGSLRLKHGCNEHPNVLQFTAALKHISVGKLFNLTSHGNCEIDQAYMLARLSQGDLTAAPQIMTAEISSTGETSGEDLPDIVEKNALYCFAGHIVQQFLKSRPADCVCGRLLRNEDEAFAGSHQILAMLQAHDRPGGLFGNLTPPSTAFFEAVERMEEEFQEYVGVVAHLQGVASVLQDKLTDKLAEGHCCSEKCRTDLLQQFCQTRLIRHIEDLNKLLKRQRERKSAAKRKFQKLTN